MRIRIVFSLANRGASVPFHHQYLLSDLFSSITELSKYRDYITYNFSGLKGEFKTEREGLRFFSSKITLVLSSPDEGFIQLVLRSLSKRGEIVIGTLFLVLLYAEKEIPLPFENPTPWICISPISVTEISSTDHKIFIDPSEDTFSDLLYEDTMDKIEQSGLFSVEQISSFSKFQLIPDKEYLRKIIKENKKFSRIYPLIDNQVIHETRGYTFPFVLHAAAEVQEFLFSHGLGRYNHKGFGMIDRVARDKNDLIPYEFSKS